METATKQVKINIQVSESGKSWDECPAVLAGVELPDWKTAVAVAKGIAITNGRQVRLTECFGNVEIGQLNGHYIMPE